MPEQDRVDQRSGKKGLVKKVVVKRPRGNIN